MHAHNAPGLACLSSCSNVLIWLSRLYNKSFKPRTRGSQLGRNHNFPQRSTTMNENQVVLKRQKYSMWFKLDDVRPLAFFVILACLLGWMPYIVSALGAADITA